MIILLSSFQQIIAITSITPPASTQNNSSVSIQTSSTAVDRKLGVTTVTAEDLLTACNSAKEGDTIEFQGGTAFAPSSTVSDSSAIAITIPISIQCLDLANQCELNGLGDRRAIHISSGNSNTTSLIGLNIKGGYADVSSFSPSSTQLGHTPKPHVVPQSRQTTQFF